MRQMYQTGVQCTNAEQKWQLLRQQLPADKQLLEQVDFTFAQAVQHNITESESTKGKDFPASMENPFILVGPRGKPISQVDGGVSEKSLSSKGGG